ncbi:hypothetical protein O3M35_006879 [Rhynocoris fuscipes]|uniref:PBZ-type domain-containing protein n=1 Tax=Rhynocoris fuscipes TaxID=488301 RepID=A0AAW1DGF4_9HEMI
MSIAEKSFHESCELGDKCYRKKKKHFRLFYHSHLDELVRNYSLDVPETYIPKISNRTFRSQLNYHHKLFTRNYSKGSSDSDEDICQELNAIVEKHLPNPTLNSIMSSESNRNTSKKICSYGEKCYRQNPQHFQNFDHPHLNSLLKLMKDGEISIPNEYNGPISHETLKGQLKCIRDNFSKEEKSEDKTRRSDGNRSPLPSSSDSSVIYVEDDEHKNKSSTMKSSPKQSQDSEECLTQKANLIAQAQAYRVVVLDRAKYPILDKLMAAAPYSFFLTTVSDSPATHNEMLSVTFAELIDPNLGPLESSLQINFMVQLSWVLAQYHIMGHRNKPMTLIYGDVDMDLNRFKHFLTAVKVKPPSTFGSHHTKMMIFSYSDQSIRIVVATANLVESDWDNRTQGLWISPRCRPLDVGSDTMAGDSPTNFKRDVIKYLSAYNLPELVPWIKKLQKVNMSAIKVFFISSVPGSHRAPAGNTKHDWGHPSLAKILNERITLAENNSYPVLVQCSSIGSLGSKPEDWLLGDMLTTFTSGKRNGVYSKPKLKFIYPSFENIANSYDGILGGGCLPYSRATHLKQEWLTSFMCQWTSDKRHRTRAPPHIKSYCRVSPDYSKLSYFVLTSANMSKAAWGMLNKSGTLNILSYEAGVLFLPQFFIEKDYFPLTEELSDKNAPIFPMPYDLPPLPFAFSDVPWFIDSIL